MIILAEKRACVTHVGYGVYYFENEEWPAILSEFICDNPSLRVVAITADAYVTGQTRGFTVVTEGERK